MKKRQIVFTGLIIIFCAPLLVAFLLLQSGYQPKHTTQNGQLLNPPIAVPNLASEQWAIMIYLPGAVCKMVCQEKKLILPNVVKALGEKQHRVKYILGTQLQDDSQIDFPGWQVHTITLQELLLLEGVYIVNPLGQIILHYPMGSNARDILKDLRKLLKYSKIG